MPIHPDCEKKILELGSGEAINKGFLDLFRAVANDAKNQDSPSGTMIMLFYDESSNLQPGDWCAELHFVTRKVESVDETDDTSADLRTDDDQEPEEEGPT